jgi:hypothetical protein
VKAVLRFSWICHDKKNPSSPWVHELEGIVSGLEFNSKPI